MLINNIVYAPKGIRAKPYTKAPTLLKAVCNCADNGCKCYYVCNVIHCLPPQHSTTIAVGGLMA